MGSEKHGCKCFEDKELNWIRKELGVCSNFSEVKREDLLSGRET